MTATVYIIGWNGDQWLPACLETLRGASAHQVHLVVIDNHNNPGIAALPLDRFDARIVKTPRQMAFADAHNFGIVAAPPKTELVVLLNQDTKSSAGWIDRCAEELIVDPKLGVVMPGLRTYDGEAWDVNFLACARRNPNLVARLEGGSVELADKGPKRGCFYVPAVTGAAMVVRTAVLWEVGLFDPVFESYYEDFDFCRRVHEAGWKLGICPQALVCHFLGSTVDSPKAELRRHRWIIRNRVIHGLRGAGNHRVAFFMRHLFLQLPWSLARGLVRTASSQPVQATLQAHASLLPLLPRLLSPSRDKHAWEVNLKRMGWPV